MTGQRDTSGQGVWMAGMEASAEGEVRHVGWCGEGVAGGLSRGESDPARSGPCWFWSTWSFSSSRRIPSWNISASSSLEWGNIRAGSKDGSPIRQVWEAVPQSRHPRECPKKLYLTP